MRLTTRSDFDGLVCAVLLKNAGIIESYKFVHPKDVQDGKVEATEDDIAANIPYIPGCGLWFEHHMSEDERLKFSCDFKGESRWEKSCARVIYDYYGGAAKFPGIEAMMTAVDKTDSGDLTVDEVKTLVVDDKWLATLAADVQTELDRVSQALTTRIRQLAKRYATPLPQLTQEVEALSATVDQHLQRMGFVWN